jgi:hypothetical protein
VRFETIAATRRETDAGITRENAAAMEFIPPGTLAARPRSYARIEASATASGDCH